MTNSLVPYQEKKLTKEEQIRHILAEVASGRALSRVLKEDEGMPSKTMFWGWHMDDETLQDNLARARENGVEALMEEAREIADTPIESIELMEEIGADGVKRRRTVKEALGHRRLQVDTRLQYARMIKPRKYGAKLDVTSDGERVGNEPLDEVSRATRLAAIMAGIAGRLEAPVEAGAEAHDGPDQS